MLAEIQPLLTWLSLHPHWGGLATFVIAFAESLAIVGLLIPGSVLMAAIGALIGANYLPLTDTILCAVAGALVGDVLSFWLGYHFQGGMREIWPLRSFPGLLKKGENFFQKHGGKSVFLGRFAGPIRPVVPLIAGMLSMSPIRFFIASALSAILWAPMYMLPGILIATASQALAPKAASEIILFIVLALFILACVFWLLKRIYSYIVGVTHQRVTQSWNVIQQSPRYATLQHILRDAIQPNKPTPLILALWLLIVVILFFILTYNIITHGILTGLNEPIYHLMRSIRTPAVDHFFIAMTLFSVPVLIPMWLAVFCWLGYRKYWWAAWHWLAVGILAGLGAEFFKTVIHSPRPEGLFKTPNGWSFPSGHTTFNVALFGFLAVLLSHSRSSVRRLIIFAVAFCLPLLVMLSRLYLTAHWFTDIIGGILLAVGSILVATISFRRKSSPQISLKGIVLVLVLSLALSWTWAMHHQYRIQVRNHTPVWQFRTIQTDAWWNQTIKQDPVYRTNRFGKPVETLNIEWAGPLSVIEQKLTQNGWIKLAKPSLIIALNGLTNTTTRHQPLFLDQLYEDRKAVLVMAKVVQSQQNSSLLMIHLWDAHLILDNSQPLWLGIISYRKPWHLHFLKRNNKDATILPAATDILTNDLKNFIWKKIPLSPDVAFAIAKNNSGNYVLLIR